MDAWVYDRIEGGSKQDFGYPDVVEWYRQPSAHLLHTTEGTSFPSYSGGASVPHATIDVKNKKTRQHLPRTEGARALQYKGHGTNSRGFFQYEIIGYAKDMQNLADDEIAYIAHVLTVFGEGLDIPVKSTVEFKGVNDAYGSGSSTRLSYSEWDKYEGILGHQHAPDNSHWDPGEFPIDKLLKAMGGNVTPPKPKPSKPKNSKYDLLEDDGVIAEKTIKRWQEHEGTSEDGEIWHQNAKYEDIHTAFIRGVKWESYDKAKAGGGSPLIKAATSQKDGILGYDGAKDIQRMLTKTKGPDGKAYYTKSIDGKIELKKDTAKGLQRFLNDKAKGLI